MSDAKDNGLLIDGLEFVSVAATEIERVWKSTGVKADPDGPTLEVEVFLVPVRKYKAKAAHFQRRRDKLGENAPDRLFQQIDDEQEVAMHDLCLAGWRGATLANLVSILRASKKFNVDTPAFQAMLKSNQELPFEALIPTADGGKIRLSRYIYSNAFPSKFANVITNAVVEGGADEEAVARLGKDDFED